MRELVAVQLAGVAAAGDAVEDGAVFALGVAERALERVDALALATLKGAGVWAAGCGFGLR